MGRKIFENRFYVQKKLLIGEGDNPKSFFEFCQSCRVVDFIQKFGSLVRFLYYLGLWLIVDQIFKLLTKNSNIPEFIGLIVKF